MRLSYIVMSLGSMESSTSSMNFSASLSRRDSGESKGRIPIPSMIGSESKEGLPKSLLLWRFEPKRFTSLDGHRVYRESGHQ